ncbi:hypothetical protein RHABOEDO_001677 [Candidatus Rhabdochlamydia oedothoracis]|uniref:Uncharacterized protein n=1 Tax=Candidatus Rhabdochlamydia oedothoracis TaxID=2720720 RepID=A0ABX8V7C9_9BACT|nr:hypothetical protein RHOW815_000710 [Candidatus Rhabdochlamydia sp. W815]QYF49355.1 hypothetical protein RHABOEDO_001677 [Candidatus Rhabdochlamydia oedothoracis]
MCLAFSFVLDALHPEMFAMVSSHNNISQNRLALHCTLLPIYPHPFFAKSVQEILEYIVEIAKRNALHTFTVISRKWIVKRSFAWIEKCRRLWKN